MTTTTTTTKPYEIVSAHWHRSVKASIFQAAGERDALHQYIVELGYEEPDFSEAYQHEGHLLVAVENDEVWAREITRPCSNCGHEVASTKPDVDICRDCFYAGVGHKDRQPGLTQLLKNQDGVEDKSVGIWHTGGGCFALGAVFAGGWELLITDGENDVPGGDPTAIKWVVGLYDEDQSGWVRSDVDYAEIANTIDELRLLAETAGAARDF